MVGLGNSTLELIKMIVCLGYTEEVIINSLGSIRKLNQAHTSNADEEKTVQWHNQNFHHNHNDSSNMRC